MYIDVRAGSRPWTDVYKICIGVITPRPIALVSTCAPDGALNLAPYSFFNMVCARPPVVIVCPTVRRDGSMKDTLRNIQLTREFVIAAAVAPIAQQMNACAADLPYGRSEWEFSGLTPVPATIVRPPCVKESPVNLECTLREIKTIGEGPGSANIVFGDILALHVADEVLDADGIPDPHKLPTVGRLGGTWYCNVTQPYSMPIPKP